MPCTPELEMRDRQLLGITFFGLEAITMAEDQHIEVAAVDIVENALTYGLAVRPIAVNRLVPGCPEPFHDGPSFRLQIRDGGRNVDLSHQSPLRAPPTATRFANEAVKASLVTKPRVTSA